MWLILAAVLWFVFYSCLFGGGNMERAVFRFIEHELFSYERTKQEIQELREEIMSDSSRWKATLS